MKSKAWLCMHISLLKNGVSLTPPILGSNLSPDFLTG
jgi:hypothetical protein